MASYWVANIYGKSKPFVYSVHRAVPMICLISSCKVQNGHMFPPRRSKSLLIIWMGHLIKAFGWGNCHVLSLLDCEGSSDALWDDGMKLMFEGNFSWRSKCPCSHKCDEERNCVHHLYTWQGLSKVTFGNTAPLPARLLVIDYLLIGSDSFFQ